MIPSVYAGSKNVSLSGASQGIVDLGEKWRKFVVQADMRTNSSYTVLLQPTKGSATDVFSSASQTKWGNAIACTTTNAAFANQPAGTTTLYVASSSTADTTQDIIVYATTATGGAVKAYRIRLKGTTKTVIGSTYPYEAGSGNFQSVLGIELSAACAGTVTLSEESGDQAIKAIAAGTTSAGVTDVPVHMQSAFGLPVYTDVSAGTKLLGVYGEPTVPDGTDGEELTSNTAGVYTTRCYSRIKKLLWGDMANSTTATFGQYGIILGSGGPIVLTDKGADGGPENSIFGCRYLTWAVYNTATLTAGGAADRLSIELFG